MASNNARMYWRSIPGGTGTNGVTLTAKRMSDGATIASGVTAGAGNEAGRADIAVGYPGPHYVEGTNSGTTLRASSRDVGFIGTFSAADLPMLHMGEFANGVLSGILDELAVSSDGSGLDVDVATGGFVVNGHPFANSAIANLAVTANASGNARIDTVVVRLTQPGQTLEGKIELAVVAGTPAASPVAPSLTQTSATWEEALADVAVANGASIPGAITDRRAFAGPRFVDSAAIEASPTFTGTATFDDIAADDVSLDALTLTGQTHHSLAAPPAIVAGAAAGSTGAVSSVQGGHEWATFILTPGGTGIAAGTLATVTFPTARPNDDYHVSLDALDEDAAVAVRDVGIYASQTGFSTTGFSILVLGALSSGTTYRLGYLVKGS